MNSAWIFCGKTGHAVRILGQLSIAVALIAWSNGLLANEVAPVRYLAFQIFTGGFDSDEMRQSFPPSSENYLKTVADLHDRISTARTEDRKLGFILGPIAFDTPDEKVRALISNAFDIALKTGVAAGFHVDDSMFWGRLNELNTIDNVEWLDWNRTPNTGRRLDWSAKPTKVMPQLCFNSKAVKEAVTERAALIGEEVAKGVHKLKAKGREDLFLGVIAGWETQIGRDFDTGRYLGYCALANAGFSAKNPPIDIDRERGKIVADFIVFWAQSLVKSGVPEGKVYSHIAFMSDSWYKMASRMNPSQVSEPYLQTINFTPPETAFSTSCVPGFSTYPQPGHLEQLQEELKKHGNPPWASCEGTAMDPAQAGRPGSGMDMEGYLGNLFNHGARLVNIFGWGVGDRDNPFRKIAEGDNALAAYRKYLRGEDLAEAPLPAPSIPPADLPGKVHRIQALLPPWLEEHGPARVKPLLEKLDGYLKQQQFDKASKTADDVLQLILDARPKK